MKHQKLLERYGLFDACVPRYTSYPPANRFEMLNEPALPKAWLSELPEGSEISVYVHIPFCRRLCWFCACRTQGAKSDAPVTRYVGFLLKEIARYGAAVPKGARVTRLHFGGGTPTILPPKEIKRLYEALNSTFPLAPGAEVSVEIDPTEICDERLDAFVAGGVNRASLGVQDFDPVVQESIGRRQSLAETQWCIDGLRARGVQSINIDVLYGLPFQTLASLGRTLDAVEALTPDRVAAFGYAHVPWMSKRQVLIPSEALPSPESRFDLFALMQERFGAAGYRQIGIDHFVRAGDGLDRAEQEGRLARNFQGYTDDTSPVLIGIGASAISRYPQGHLQNATATAAYQSRISAGDFATAKGITFTAEDKLIARLIEQLMCYNRIDFTRGFGQNEARARKVAGAVAACFPDAVDLTRDAFVVRPEARALMRIIAATFDPVKSRPGVHSIAV